MTVCIVAIYMGQSVVGASDRLLTAGDVQFQPDTPKVRTVTNSIVAMTAGDAWLQTEILAAVQVDVNASILANPERWLDVRFVAESYCSHWAEAKRRRAEASLLKPLGLTSESFVSQQATMNAVFAQDIANALIAFAMPATACLITGVDTTGPHIFSIHDGSLSQADGVGFAAIGSGARHAESQLMLARYAPNATVAASLALVHLAKTRAEVAPGVGAATDMFLIGPQLGSYMAIPPPVMGYLDRQAVKMREDERHALEEAQQGMKDFIASFGQASAEPQEAEPDLPGTHGESVESAQPD